LTVRVRNRSGSQGRGWAATTFSREKKKEEKGMGMGVISNAIGKERTIYCGSKITEESSRKTGRLSISSENSAEREGNLQQQERKRKEGRRFEGSGGRAQTKNKAWIRKELCLLAGTKIRPGFTCSHTRKRIGCGRGGGASRRGAPRKGRRRTRGER